MNPQEQHKAKKEKRKKEKKQEEKKKGELTKQSIFDLFYAPRMVTRKGGGTQRKKMTRQSVSAEDLASMEKTLDGNAKLSKYYNKLKDRSSKIAPPPRPT